MASDREERKHHRSSDDESEEPSKRRKHRHHRRRHHRHHSRKHEKHEDKREEGDEQVTDMPPPPPPANWRSDYDMEEGEIVEEDGAAVVGKKAVDSDAESGEIKTESHGDVVVPNHSPRLPSDNANNNIGSSEVVDKEPILTKEHKENGYTRVGSEKKSGHRKSHYDDDDDDDGMRDQKSHLSDDIHVKVHKGLSSKHVHERSQEDVATTSRSKSHERSRDRNHDRSRSLSVSRGASRLETHKEETEYYTSKKTNGDGDSERTNKLVKDYRHGSRDSVRDKERERSSSRSRHSLQLDKHHGREHVDRFREGSWETRDRDRERYRDRELKEIERDRMKKDREWEWERERDRRERGRRDREREKKV